VTVVTDKDSYACGHAIVAAGAWMPGLLGGAFAKPLRVVPQSVFWFEPARDDAAAFSPERFPIFIWRYGQNDEEHFYGIPDVGGGLKLATEQFERTIQPDAERPTPTQSDASRMFERHIHGRLSGVTSTCVRATTCLYTVSGDFGFIVDRHPDRERVFVASPCSGHGFKHAPAVGEALVEWALEGRSRLDLSAFSLTRIGHMKQ
jgi:sarcosine oxidase